LKEEISNLEKIMNLKYASFLKSRKFSIKHSLGESSCLVEILLKNDDESFWYPIEAKMELLESDLKDREASLLLLDYIDSFFGSYFQEDENIFVPIDWSSRVFEGETIYIKGQKLNLKVEKRAAEFLKVHS